MVIVQVAIKVFEFTLKYSNEGRLSNVKVKFQKETFNENDKELVLSCVICRPVKNALPLLSFIKV